MKTNNKTKLFKNKTKNKTKTKTNINNNNKVYYGGIRSIRSSLGSLGSLGRSLRKSIFKKSENKKEIPKITEIPEEEMYGVLNTFLSPRSSVGSVKLEQRKSSANSGLGRSSEGSVNSGTRKNSGLGTINSANSGTRKGSVKSVNSVNSGLGIEDIEETNNKKEQKKFDKMVTKLQKSDYILESKKLSQNISNADIDYHLVTLELLYDLNREQFEIELKKIQKDTKLYDNIKNFLIYKQDIELYNKLLRVKNIYADLLPTTAFENLNPHAKGKTLKGRILNQEVSEV